MRGFFFNSNKVIVQKVTNRGGVEKIVHSGFAQMRLKLKYIYIILWILYSIESAICSMQQVTRTFLY